MDNKQKELTRSLSALGSGLSALSEIVKRVFGKPRGSHRNYG